MAFDASMDIIEFDSFDTAFPVEPGSEGAAKRRFMTLFAQSAMPAAVGGTSYVCQVQSFTGETFALKRLLPLAGVPEGAVLSDEDTARITQGHAAAFYEEYKNQLLVSRLRGFPGVYGYGLISGSPAILMEWVEGVPLRSVTKRALEADGAEGSAGGSARDKGAESPFSGVFVARLGLAVLQVLDTLARLDATLVHRDISPANIMLRTGAVPLSDQLESGAFDLCLIDFGSAAAFSADDASFTMAAKVWRNGTPEYAPPEMLTQDIPGIGLLRKSQKIDVFALCSVLYELYCGSTPWRVAEHPDISPYRLKTETPPAPLAARNAQDEPLVAAIASGLRATQNERPDVAELARMLQSYLHACGAEPAEQPGAAATTGAEGAAAGAEVAPSSEDAGGTGALFTPESTRLQVASQHQGGMRAGDAVQAFQAEPRGISRRALVAGGIALVAAVGLAGGAGAWFARQAGSASLNAQQINGAALASSTYSGPAPYLVRGAKANEWKLLVQDRTSGIALDAGGHEPGPMVDGLMRVYLADATGNSSGWGFQTLEDASGELQLKWALGHTYANARDFSSMADPADPADPLKRFAAVQDAQSKLWGFIYQTGEDCTGACFADAGVYSNGYAAVRLAEGERPWTLIDASGNQQAGLKAEALGRTSAEGLTACKSSGTWGFVFPDGTPAFNATWGRVRRFSCGLAGVLDAQSGLWGFIDTNGQEAIQAQFADVRPFATGDEGPLAPAQDAKTQLWGLIGQDGAWVVEPRYLKLGEKCGSLWPAHGSPANVYTPPDPADPAWAAYYEAGGDSDGSFGYGYIASSGTWAYEPVYADTLIRASAQ